MSRYANIKWAGQTVRTSVDFLLSIIDQTWKHQRTGEWEPVALVMEQLGIAPLVAAYNAVAEEHGERDFSMPTKVKGLIAGSTDGKDRAFVLEETRFIEAVFMNTMQYMDTRKVWSESQELSELVALDRLANLIRFLRGVVGSSEK